MRFLVPIAALLISCAANAQVPITGAGKGTPGAGGGFTPSCTPSTNFLARATGITSNTDKTNYDNLICGLVTDGLCCAATGGVLDFLHVYAAPDSTTAKLNLTQNAYNLTQTGSLTFNANVGFTGDGSTGFFDTGFSLLSSVGNFALTGNTIGCYVKTSRAAAQNYAAIGAVDVNGETRLYPNQGAGPGGLIFENTDGSAANFFTVANAQGLWISTRTSSVLTTLYKNNLGSQATSAHASQGSYSASFNVYEFASNATGTTSAFSADQMTACFMGAGMTSTQVNNLQSRLNTFMTAYGVNVY